MRTASAPLGPSRSGTSTLEDYGIEIGTAFGPWQGEVWRIGTMGHNARRDAVLVTLAAFEQVLRAAGVAVPAGGGVAAAQDVYGQADGSGA